MHEIEFIEMENFLGLGRAIKIQGHNVEVVVTIDVGPRIMQFSKLGGINIFEDNVEESTILPDGTQYKIYGGHRLSHSPEAFPRSYISDSSPLEKYEKLNDGIRMYQNIEQWTQIQKIIEVHLLSEKVKIVNKLVNKGAWPIEFSAWSITVVPPDGLEVCPITQRDTGLLPNTYYVFWPYSRTNDSRLKWGQKYIIIKGNRNEQAPFKFGYYNEYGWIAYFNRGMLFIKKFTNSVNSAYPDFGCNYETYTTYWGTELETLSPLQVVNPDETIVHEEEWYLFESDYPTEDEEQISLKLSNFVDATGIRLPGKIVRKERMV
jgi:hypothetical protein